MQLLGSCREQESVTTSRRWFVIFTGSQSARESSTSWLWQFISVTRISANILGWRLSGNLRYRLDLNPRPLAYQPIRRVPLTTHPPDSYWSLSVYKIRLATLSIKMMKMMNMINVLQHNNPMYLRDLLTTHNPSRNLRSSSQHLLYVGYMRTASSSRCFKHSAAIN